MTIITRIYTYLVDLASTVRDIARAVAFARTHPTNLQDMDCLGK